MNSIEVIFHFYSASCNDKVELSLDNANDNSCGMQSALDCIHTILYSLYDNNIFEYEDKRHYESPVCAEYYFDKGITISFSYDTVPDKKEYNGENKGFLLSRVSINGQYFKDSYDIEQFMNSWIKELLRRNCTMTNKDFMCTLDTDDFEQAMHTLYFEPRLWVEGSEVEKRSTPNMFRVRAWLASPYDPNSAFWTDVLSEENVPQQSSNISENKDAPFCNGCHAAEICYGVDIEHCVGYKSRAKQAMLNCPKY